VLTVLDARATCIVLVDVADTDPVARHARAVERDGQLGLAADLERADVGCALDRVQHADHLFAFVFQDLQVGAENLDDDFAFRSRQGFVQIVFDHLRKIGRHAGHRMYFLRHVGDHRVLAGKAPRLARLEIGHDFEIVGALGIGAVVGTADLGYDIVDFGITFSMRRTSRSTSLVRSMAVDGGNVIVSQILPSSSLGRNSLPRLGASASASASSASERPRPVSCAALPHASNLR